MKPHNQAIIAGINIIYIFKFVIQTDIPSIVQTTTTLSSIMQGSSVCTCAGSESWKIRLSIVMMIMCPRCGYDQAGFLKQTQTTDGVLGLSSGTASLSSQWEKQGPINNVIGICIAGEGKKGRYMFLGDDHVPTSSMTWVPALRQPM